MAILSVQRPTKAGASVTMAAASAGGDSFANDGRTAFRVRNAHATVARTVTFASPNACSFGVTNAAHNRAVSVPALTTLEIGPFDQNQFNNTSTGRITVTYSTEADLTVAAVRQ